MKIIPRPRDKIVSGYLKRRFRKGDIFTAREVIQELKERVGKNAVLNEMRWLVNLRIIKRLSMDEWKEVIIQKSDGVLYRRKVLTFEVLKNL